MTPREWEGVLLDATERVKLKVSALARGGGRGRTVGTGASGDKTIFADKEAEEELLRSLKSKGGVRVLSEEAGEVGDRRARTLAVVDPLDGSSNFERGIPFYCTSVAIVEGDSLSDVVFGLVRDLVSGDVYVARRGKGATKNGRAIRTSHVATAAEAIVGIDISRTAPELVTGLSRLVSGVKRQVHLGANALELCFLAEGKVDAFVDLREKMRITDFAAAYLIATESGAKVTGPDGDALEPRFDLKHRFSFVASANPALHRQILELCKGSGAGKG
ncbi:MAG TPA: inositol monophosphatase family protein [Nitrososphaerales archaeon]|nr:inositol monophosphatase family protein [Nitrososphaerales archaeon]